MKKKILSLLVTGCLLFVPTTAFADDNKTVIKTVDDLLAFSKAVNNGDYDKNKDAVVVLENDLDLTGVVWTPIGSVFNEKGELEHYFSGKFYGNGHTISNIDFTSIYGKDVLVGFFGDIEEAEVSGLTIEGNLDVTNTDNDYTFYGTIAGFAGDCTITDCVSNVSFNNNGKYVYGFMGMVGQADGTTFEYCENTADITISGDSSSLYVGGIVGYAQNGTEVRYCSNTGDMVYAAANAGGIVGSINGGSVSDCYFAGEIDLSQYSARKPYTRFGGIVGKDSSSTPDFKNNYFTKTEDVEACGSNKEAGEAKAYDYMTTKDFYDELTANGAKYQYVEGKTPVLPTMEYAVDFEVTPADLKNVAIKVDGKEITGNTAMLTAGTYTVEVTADDCEPLSKEITISADIATHTQAFELAYKSADYTELDKAEKAAKALNKDDYEDFSEVEKALAAIDRTKNITEQADVDAMVKAINDAVANLVKKAPASSQPDSVSSSDASSDTSSSASDSSSSDSKSDSSSKAASNASNTNPSTGVAGGAFALALLSGAAVVMAKKKK
ncbi:GLUG motif-containing protein [Ruminococcus bicirculans (ex Wegman et al. 2014)]|uniref:GLUG motif-containing protein n=1 Tax=Ruminococcus bicirculans (ex Wegman et al. 2014) TaxID=1160721 RepID=UPI00242C8F30|nr:GLUG motif-containing protein [Ruminococcus bicirculans (ex Wegman et al. 2014)]